MKGLFIPEITAEMFRNGCLESIETLMAEGEIYDIEYPLEQEEQTEWIPVEDRLPEIIYYAQQNEVHCSDEVVAQIYDRQLDVSYCEILRYCEDGDDKFWANTIFRIKNTVIAWMPLPKPYRGKRGRG